MKQLKISTVNLFNLQKERFATYFGNRTSHEDYEGKTDWTANLLKQMDADIIAFQELWHRDALEYAFEKAGLKDQYEFAVNDNHHSASVALAVKRPLDIVHRRWVSDVPDELMLTKSARGDEENNLPPYEMDVQIRNFSRPILRVNVKYNDDLNIICYVAHLKSKLPMNLSRESYFSEVKPHVRALGSAMSTIRRAAEAAGLRIMLNKEMKNNDKPVIVLGDLNDSQLSVTTSIITESPRHKLYNQSRIGRKSDAGLYSVATLQELRSLRDVYYTYIHNGFRESLDHILVSEQFYDFSDKRIWSFMETRIINDHIDDRDGIGYGSDHGVVLSTFNFDPNED